MHIKRTHEMIEKIVECANSQFAKGIDCVDTEEMEKVSEIIKNLACAEKDFKIAKAMDEAEYYESIDKYEEYDPRFYDNYRYKNGRFAPKGRGTRRGYDEPMYQMTPEMYREHDSEWYRDMDKKSGKMYYSEPSGNNMSNSRYENAKRGYEESKAMHKDNSVESKQTKMKDLENYLKELSEDVTRLVSDASQEEKALLKSKMQLLLQKLN